MPLSDYPELEEYSWQECHNGFVGAGGLFMVSDAEFDVGVDWRRI